MAPLRSKQLLEENDRLWYLKETPWKHIIKTIKKVSGLRNLPTIVQSKVVLCLFLAARAQATVEEVKLY